MVKVARTAGFLAALFLISAAPAHAAFFPDLSVELDPATEGKSPRLTATISQPATDTAIERFTLTLPAGFTRASAPDATSCDVALMSVGGCPSDSAIGTYSGELGGSAPITGWIVKTGSDSFGMFVSILGGAITQGVEGSLIKRSNGALDLQIDQLPALPITQLALQFWRGDFSLIRNPARCGEFLLDGKFTSRRGELAIDRTTVSIGGCDGAPAVRVENVRFSDRRFQAGGSPYAGRTIIAWWLSQAVDRTRLRIERRKNGTWRRVGTLVGTGNAGDNSLHWDGRLHGDKLEPGAYGVRIQPAGSAASKRFRFRILD